MSRLVTDTRSKRSPATIKSGAFLLFAVSTRRWRHWKRASTSSVCTSARWANFIPRWRSAVRKMDSGAFRPASVCSVRAIVRVVADHVDDDRKAEDEKRIRALLHLNAIGVGKGEKL